MQVSDEGVDHIKRWEGKGGKPVLTAYLPTPNDRLTIGYGHTSAAGKPEVYAGMVITAQDAENILRRDLAKFEARVNRLVKVPLTQHQFDALVSFDLNTGSLDSSTLLKKLNAGNYAAVPGEMMRWTKQKGKTLPGLVNRRSAEVGLWSKGSFVAGRDVAASPVRVDQDVAIVASSGVGAAGVTVAPVIPEIADALTNQQNELSSGDWMRVTIAAIILGLSLYGVYRKVRA